MMSYALDPPPPCHKLSHLLGPPPPSMTYFMDGPISVCAQKIAENHSPRKRINTRFSKAVLLLKKLFVQI